MKRIESRSPFAPQTPDAAGIVSWIHLGDLHMKNAGDQNHLDLVAIVDEVNRVFADTVSFIFLPGDVADDGSRTAYGVVRAELDRLTTPWCAIIGDHDVHEMSFANFQEAMSDQTRYAFTVGQVRFIAMNAFDVPHPGSFAVSGEQLAWVKYELQSSTDAGQTKVLLLHCYPSDLKVGAAELTDILHRFEVQLIDMGHTHYNEIANDGRTLYTATRSTGQIEEGSVGYSVTNIDGDAISWRFIELGKLPIVVITSPSDERMLTGSNESPKTELKVRAKFWSKYEAVSMKACVEGHELLMTRIGMSQVWEASMPSMEEGYHELKVEAQDRQGTIAEDKIRLVVGDCGPRNRVQRDQDNALEAWPEHGLLGTQLGPNKHGKKW